MLNHFAAPRTSAVEKFFRTQSDSDLLGAYSWCQAVSAALFPILGDFEVALRNALHSSLSQHYGQVDSFDWMMTAPNPAAATNPRAKPLPAAHKMSSGNKGDIEKVVGKVRRKKGVVTPDDVVAALAFGFWEQLLQGMWHNSNPEGFPAAIMSKVFPFAPDLATCSYDDTKFRDRVVELLVRVRDMRNRIGHHDSIWAVPEFDLRGKIGFIPRRPRHTINSLKKFSDNLCWFAGWINPEIPAYIKGTDHWWSFQVLLSQNALATYRRLGGRIGTYKTLLNSSDVSIPKKRNGLDRPLPAFKERMLNRGYYY